MEPKAWTVLDANKNSVAVTCAHSQGFPTQSQLWWGRYKPSPDEAKEAQREQDSPRSPCELVTELQVGSKPPATPDTNRRTQILICFHS